MARYTTKRARAWAPPGRATLWLACGLLTGAQAAASPTLLRAQSLAQRTATPEATATLFLRSVRAIRWDAAAQLTHPRTLERFHTLVTMMSEADSAGQVRTYLTGTDAASYPTLSPADVFERALGAMMGDMPGLMHAVFDRDDEVLGHVLESADTAHVVYRTTARLSGAVPEVKVMQLTRTAAGWRVAWSDELEVLEAALRGVGRGRPSPPPAGSTPGQPERHVQVIGGADVPQRVEAERPERQFERAIAPLGAALRAQVHGMHPTVVLLEVE